MMCQGAKRDPRRLKDRRRIPPFKVMLSPEQILDYEDAQRSKGVRLSASGVDDHNRTIKKFYQLPKEDDADD